MATKQAYTFEVLGGYLNPRNEIAVEYLNDEMWYFIAEANTKIGQRLWFEIPNKRRSVEAMCNWVVKEFINDKLKDLHRGYDCTNPQILKFCNEHGGLGWETFRPLAEKIREARENKDYWED